MITLHRTAFLAGLLAAVVGGAGLAGTADARDRSSSVTTQRGTFNGQTSKGCSGGTCTREQSVTGPNGKTAERSGSVTKNGQGDYSYTREATGPNGKAIERSGTVTTTRGN